MAKVIAKAKVYQVEMYIKKDGSEGARVVAFVDDGSPVVFYRAGNDIPVKDDVYNMVLGYDRSLNAVVRYQRDVK